MLKSESSAGDEKVWWNRQFAVTDWLDVTALGFCFILYVCSCVCINLLGFFIWFLCYVSVAVPWTTNQYQIASVSELGLV